jgi:phage head maturation protease
MARTRAGSLRLSEDGTGLHVEAKLDPKRPDVQTIRSAIENRELDEMSFSFMVDPGGDKWSEDGSTRRITSVNMDRGADVSVVNFGASPHTGGTVDLRRLGWTNPTQVSQRLRSAGIRAPQVTQKASARTSRLGRPMTPAEWRICARSPEMYRHYKKLGAFDR